MISDQNRDQRHAALNLFTNNAKKLTFLWQKNEANKINSFCSYITLWKIKGTSDWNLY